MIQIGGWVRGVLRQKVAQIVGGPQMKKHSPMHSHFDETDGQSGTKLKEAASRWQVRLKNGLHVDAREAAAFALDLEALISEKPRAVASLYEMAIGRVEDCPSEFLSILRRRFLLDTFAKVPETLKGVVESGVRFVDGSPVLEDPFDKEDAHTEQVLDRLEELQRKRTLRILGHKDFPRDKGRPR